MEGSFKKCKFGGQTEQSQHSYCKVHLSVVLWGCLFLKSYVIFVYLTVLILMYLLASSVLKASTFAKYLHLFYFAFLQDAFLFVKNGIMDSIQFGKGRQVKNFLTKHFLLILLATQKTGQNSKLYLKRKKKMEGDCTGIFWGDVKKGYQSHC